MMKEKLRCDILSKVGKKLHFKYNGARNQNEDFFGYIDQIYSNIFTIRVLDKENFCKAFSYNDVLTETLEILDK